MKRFIALLLAAVMLLSLAACGGEQKPETLDTPDVSENANAPVVDPLSGKFPVNEYERGIWYGFLPDELTDADPDTTVVTWKQYCAMLGKMISAYDQSKLPEWEEMTAGAPDTELLRDGAAMANLFAAKVTGLDYCNRNCSDLYADTYSWGHHFTWDYPIFDWESPSSIGGAEASDENAIASAFWYLLGRASCITNEPLMAIDNGDPHLEEGLTVYDAVVSVTRFYESVEEVAADTAHKILAMVLETEEAQKLVAQVEQRKSEIINSPTAIVKSNEYIQGETYTGTAYYVSNNGDDADDGLSPETPFATMERLQEVEFEFGDAVFFERGSIWRKAMLPQTIINTEGITLSAYGKGEKPKFYGSPENGGGAENWELYFEGENGEKIWKYKNEMTDCPAIVGPDDTLIAKRDLAYWDGESYLVYEDISQPYNMIEQLKNRELFIDLPYEKSQVPEHLFIERWDDELQQHIYLTGPLYVRLDEGNPGELYDSIEFLAAYALSDGLAEYTTIDNFDISYSGGSVVLGGSYLGDSKDHITCQNSVVGWVGGHVQFYDKSTVPDHGIGYGHDIIEKQDDPVEIIPKGDAFIDGGGFNTNGSYETIRNCYAHHCFQEACTLETFADDTETCQYVTIENNVVEYCVMGMPVYNWDPLPREEHLFSNVLSTGNYVMYSGFENYYFWPTIIPPEGEGYDWDWGAQMGILNRDAHAFATSYYNAHDGTFTITGNTYAFSVGTLTHTGHYYEEYLNYFKGNTYVQLPGFSWFENYDHNNDGEFNAGYRKRYFDPEEAILGMLHDEDATIITFD